LGGRERLGRSLRNPDEIGVTLGIVVGYLAGSVPSGYWLVRVFKHEDVRKRGSGNIGATNVWRTYGRWYGVPVVLLDTAKGFVPALVFSLTVSPLAGVLAGAGAMLGHARPLFLRFEKGGKMVATTGGAFLGVAPIVGAVGLCVWIVGFLLTRYASVASMLAAVSLPVAAVLLGYSWPVIVFAAFAAAAVILLHRANIKRLLSGTESRFRLKRRARAAPSSSRSL
jgi:glycerol-3-phosphate acyltransferase PlsY